MWYAMQRCSHTRRFGTLASDSASRKSWESFIQFTFCNSCIRPENSNIMFWSSNNFRLAIVSNVELWNFLNSSISLRLLWWASRNSKFCWNNCPWRSCWSRRWKYSARAAWHSCWWTLTWHSARICSFCLSSRVLICQRVAPFKIQHWRRQTDRQVFS